MAVHFHVRTSESMPERLNITQDIERRIRQQEEAKQSAREQKTAEAGKAQR